MSEPEEALAKKRRAAQHPERPGHRCNAPGQLDTAGRSRTLRSQERLRDRLPQRCVRDSADQ